MSRTWLITGVSSGFGNEMTKQLLKKGDTVKMGQVIGEANGFMSVPVHASVSGTVLSVDVFATRVKTDDGNTVIIPNGKVFGSVIVLHPKA